MTRFGHENHNIYTYETQKASLSSFNDKRWISRIDSNKWLYHSFGHKDISQLQNLDYVINQLDSDCSDNDEDEYNISCLNFFTVNIF